MLTIGLRHTSYLTVSDCDTAQQVGSGDMPVLATPRMMALMENAAMQAVANELAEDETTVGGHISSSHLAPTLIGQEVKATATLTKIEGRKLYFNIEAHQKTAQGEKLIGQGSHLRFIVNKEKFLRAK